MPFTNRNICRSYNVTLSTTLVALTAQECSELTIYNRTGQTVEVYDSSYPAAVNAFILSNNDSFVVRGITNSNQVSAKTTLSGGTLCWRTQYFSNFTQGV